MLTISLAWCWPAGVPAICFDVNCDGVHLSWGRNSLAMSWPQPRRFWLGWSNRAACNPGPLGRLPSSKVLEMLVRPNGEPGTLLVRGQTLLPVSGWIWLVSGLVSKAEPPSPIIPGCTMRRKPWACIELHHVVALFESEVTLLYSVNLPCDFARVHCTRVRCLAPFCTIRNSVRQQRCCSHTAQASDGNVQPEQWHFKHNKHAS